MKKLTHEFQPVAVQDFSAQAAEEQGLWRFFPGFSSIAIRHVQSTGQIITAQRRVDEKQIELLAKLAGVP